MPDEHPMSAGEIKIVSDGTLAGTKVMLANGLPLEAMITRIEWSLDANAPDFGYARAVVTFRRVRIEARADGFTPMPSSMAEATD